MVGHFQVKNNRAIWLDRLLPASLQLNMRQLKSELSSIAIVLYTPRDAHMALRKAFLRDQNLITCSSTRTEGHHGLFLCVGSSVLLPCLYFSMHSGHFMREEKESSSTVPSIKKCDELSLSKRDLNLLASARSPRYDGANQLTHQRSNVT